MTATLSTCVSSIGSRFGSDQGDSHNHALLRQVPCCIVYTNEHVSLVVRFDNNFVHRSLDGIVACIELCYF